MKLETLKDIEIFRFEDYIKDMGIFFKDKTVEKICKEVIYQNANYYERVRQKAIKQYHELWKNHRYNAALAFKDFFNMTEQDLK